MRFFPRFTESLLDTAIVYRLWQYPFAAQKMRPQSLQDEIRRARAVLDVGCGPGTHYPYFAHADYLGVDLNPAYVADAARRYRCGTFAVGDATRLQTAKRFDHIFVNSLLHHLDDNAAASTLANLLPLLAPGGSINVIDMTLPPAAGLARMLARHDRGAFARSLSALEGLLSPLGFTLVERYDLVIAGMALYNMCYFRYPSV